MESSPISSITNTAVKVRAFTLIEMLVVLAIMSALSLVVLAGQSTFNKSLILKDTAYSIAYSFREAQTFGLSSVRYAGTSNVSYGIFFDKVTPDQYLLFADLDNSWLSLWCPIGAVSTPDYKPGDCVYRAPYDKIIKTTKFTRGFTVQKFCAKPQNGTKRCSDTNGPTDIYNLSVTFVRPNMTPIITMRQNSGSKFLQATCAEIYLQAPEGGATRTVRVSQFGEISLNQVCP